LHWLQRPALSQPAGLPLWLLCLLPRMNKWALEALWLFEWSKPPWQIEPFWPG
jgi:hypothetical protein